MSSMRLDSGQALATTESLIQMVSDPPMNASRNHWRVTGTVRAKKPPLAPTQLERGCGIVFSVTRVAMPMEADIDGSAALVDRQSNP